MYIEKFILPSEQLEYKIARERMAHNGGACGYLDNGYPCGLFQQKELAEIDFENITILYGTNGSGKSTMLNIIANKLGLDRMSPFNTSELFNSYVDVCKFRQSCDDYGKPQQLPKNSRIITSDDIFDYMLAVRTVNQEVAENIEEGKDDYAALKFGESIKLTGLEDYETYRKQVLSRKKSLTRRKFLQQHAGKEVRLHSNGETALDYFIQHLQNDKLFCLDEPENSLSPQRQIELKNLIEKKSRYCGCQFIIATHSPFILSLNGAKIYDLDSTPVVLKKWWEVENAKTYFDFFHQNKNLFLKNNDN